jgi:glycerophosphoryl diester phosphodiesterase
MILAVAVLQIAVIAHRGEHLRHAENTLPAFQAAIDAGADYFECDVRTTADGRLVLMHDSNVDAATNLATFDEALRLAKGRIRVYVDWKDASPEALVGRVDAAKMGDRVVVYGAPAKLARLHALRPDWKIMPEAGSPERLADLIRTLGLRIAAFDHNDFKPDTIAVAKNAGIDIFVDCLGPDDNEQGWATAVERGATGIQTDHPAEVVAFLRAKGLHR